MNTKKTLIELARHFQYSRRTGHTTAMMEGAKNTECLVLAHNKKSAQPLSQLHPEGTFITLDNLHSLRATHRPVLIDNAAMAEILMMALSEINTLEVQLESMRIQNDNKGRP